MNVNYDEPRPGRAEDADEGLAALTSSHTKGRSGNADLDDTADSASESDAGPIDEEMSVPVMPIRGDEFRCGRCFLVHHRSRLAGDDGVPLCQDCA